MANVCATLNEAQQLMQSSPVSINPFWNTQPQLMQNEQITSGMLML